MEWLALLVAVLILVMGILLISAIPLVFRRHPQRNPGEPNCGIEYDNVSFTTSDGIHLYGWWFPFMASQQTIILLHGFAGSMDPDLKYVPEISHDRFQRAHV